MHNNTWDDSFPVAPEWLQERIHESVTLRFVVPLDTIIACEGSDDMDDVVCAVLPDGYTLLRIEYRVGVPEVDDDLGNKHLLLEATGVLSLGGS